MFRCAIVIAKLFAAMVFISCNSGQSAGGGNRKSDLDDAAPIMKLGWPIDCVAGKTCSNFIGYPDIDGDWVASNCGYPGYPLHRGTDFTDRGQTIGLPIYAAAAGQVMWVMDEKFDDCQGLDSGNPDCATPTAAEAPGASSGVMSCTEAKPEYCEGSQFSGTCYWCSWTGNEIMIRHYDVPGVFGTTYGHIKQGSALVRFGDWVEKGQKIAEMGSAGASPSAHLHFEVLGRGYGDFVDPWAGACGTNQTESLWEPWIQEQAGSENLDSEEEENWTCNETVCTLNDRQQ